MDAGRMTGHVVRMLVSAMHHTQLSTTIEEAFGGGTSINLHSVPTSAPTTYTSTTSTMLIDIDCVYYFYRPQCRQYDSGSC